MRILLSFLALTAFLLSDSPAYGAGVQLLPNLRWQLVFSDLPDTLASMTSGKKEPARLTVRLPANYSSEGRFPLFVFLNGGDGGPGNTLPIDQKNIGSNDFICVGLPLFRRELNTNTVSKNDLQTLSHAYEVMLQRLLDLIPNTTPERSAFGGFSNGANATAVLLAGQHEFILRHFRAFYLIEGGFGTLTPEVLQKPAMKHLRFLVLRGNQPDNEHPEERQKNDHLARALEDTAHKLGLDFTSKVMHGYGHEFPREYQTFLGKWLRGENVSTKPK